MRTIKLIIISLLLVSSSCVLESKHQKSEINAENYQGTTTYTLPKGNKISRESRIEIYLKQRQALLHTTEQNTATLGAALNIAIATIYATDIYQRFEEMYQVHNANFLKCVQQSRLPAKKMKNCLFDTTKMLKAISETNKLISKKKAINPLISDELVELMKKADNGSQKIYDLYLSTVNSAMAVNQDPEIIRFEPTFISYAGNGEVMMEIEDIFYFNLDMINPQEMKIGALINLYVGAEIFTKLATYSDTRGIFLLSPYLIYNSGKSTSGDQISKIIKYQESNSIGKSALPIEVQKTLLKALSQNKISKEVSFLDFIDRVGSFNVNPHSGTPERREIDRKKFEDRINNEMKVYIDDKTQYLQQYDTEVRKVIYEGKEVVKEFVMPSTIQYIDDDHLPDFQKPMGSQKLILPYYGKVISTVYSSVNNKLEFLVLKNKKGKIWIPMVQYVNSKKEMTKYFVNPEVINFEKTPFILSLWTESINIHPDYYPKQKIPGDAKYQSSWVNLIAMEIIQKYYKDLRHRIPKG